LDGLHANVAATARRIATTRFAWGASLGRLDALMMDQPMDQARTG
jgi:hypothetical protein